MRDIDSYTINSLNIPSILLMEHVGRDIFLKILSRHYERVSKYGVSIFSGTGGNGGDGLVLARYLIFAGIKTSIFIIGDLAKLHKDTLSNYEILLTHEISPLHIASENEALKIISGIAKHSLVVDALYGTGLSREIDGIPKTIIESINKNDNIFKIAIDIPSGMPNLIHNQTSLSFKANETYTIALPKNIFFFKSTREYLGHLFIINSIFPKKLLQSQKTNNTLINKSLLKSIHIKKSAFYSKREQGMISIIASSKKYIGASILTTQAVYGLGIGYIRLYVPYSIEESVKKIILNRMPEVVVIGVGDESTYFFNDKCLDIIDDINKSSALIIGPGLGRDESTGVFVNQILKKIKTQTVVDADALFLLEQDTLKKLNKNIILTPHIYEFAKLSNIKKDDILNNPFETLNNFRKTTNATILLKDSISFLLFENEIFTNYAPIKNMGKAGMGDVLSGFIGAMLARKLNTKDATIVSLYLQKYAFLYCSKIYGSDSVLPIQMAKKSSKVFKKMRL